MQQKFFKIIKEENDKGVTILFSSHILSEVQKLCDRIAIIKEGSIIRIDEVSALNKESYKKFKIISNDLNEADLPIDGINDFIKTNNQIAFMYKGNINEIIKIISQYEIIDLHVEEPTLEEIFMHYYR